MNFRCLQASSRASQSCQQLILLVLSEASDLSFTSTADTATPRLGKNFAAVRSPIRIHHEHTEIPETTRFLTCWMRDEHNTKPILEP